MSHESSTTYGTARPRRGVLILSGYGIRVAVERGYLSVEDGRGDERRRGRFPRTTRDLKRLVVIGHTGTVSFDALLWLSDIGCAFMQIDTGGDVIAATGGVGLDDARLRRSQALATANATGVAIARDLMSAKLAGQADVLDRMNSAEGAAATVRQWRARLESASTLDAVRACESKAAAAYWSAWAPVPIRFARKAASLVPDHWHRVGIRASPLTGSPRLAANPAHAILNYLYAILEAETRIALLTVGLDPGLGIVHADQKNRDSFACDVMEAIRPQIDAFAFDVLRSRPFGRDDFFETRQGQCRIMPTLARMLAETALRWATALGPVVEGIAQRLMDSRETGQVFASQKSLPTPLTQSNRSAGRGKTAPRPAARPNRRDALLPNACRQCGVILERSDRQHCPDCMPDHKREHGESFAAVGLAALAARRESGDDPAHGGDAGERRGKRNAAHVAALTDWNRERRESEPTPDPETFSRDILPALQGVSLRAMADATGLTQGYCSFVRRGLKEPHRRHWAVLLRLGKDS